MIPSSQFTKTDGNTGVVRPSADGVCAIIAPSATGTANQAATYGDASNVLTDRGDGPLTEWASYMLGVTGKPQLLITPTASTAAAYSVFTHTGAGSSVASAGGTAPLDDFNVIVTFVAAGTIGVTGITYKYSLDGGLTTSALQALGTASTLSIPNSGVSIALAAGTILAGQTEAFTTTSAQMTNGDFTTALEALRVTSLPWDAVLVHGPSTATTVSTLDTWLAARELEGIFATGVINTRLKAAAESEATFAAAMATAFAAASSTRVVVCTDGADMVSVVPGRGRVLPRAAALAVAARGMSQDIAIDPAYVALGALPNVAIYDARGVAKYHDELKSPGLDDLRLTALRTFYGQFGVFVNNANLISPAGSDFVYWQHARVINRACAIAWQLTTKFLSIGVQTVKDPQNPNVAHIAEADAQHIEGVVQGAVDREMKGRLSGVKFTLSRTDDLSSNGPGTVNNKLAVNALRYIKTFKTKAGFVSTL